VSGTAARAAAVGRTGLDFRREHRLGGILADVGGKVEVQIFLPGQRNPVGIEDGAICLNVRNRALGGLLVQRLVGQASFVILFIPEVNTAGSGGEPNRLGGFVTVKYGAVPVDKHDRKREVIPEKMKVPA